MSHMKYFLPEACLLHETGVHPENPDRLKSFSAVKPEPITGNSDYLSLVHAPEYITRIRDLCASGGGNLDSDTVVGNKSFAAAVAAVNATIAASQNGDFALVRPPGHHAFPDHGAGFCIFNNIAIAAEKLTREGKRVFILDIDGHLGDGTEKFYYERNDVFYASLHEFAAYPGGGATSDIGFDKGLGFTVNIPLSQESGDDVFVRGIDFILSIAEQFAPEVVAVSAGFDGHKDDRLLHLNLSTESFYRTGRKLRDKFSNIFAVLEGGYNLTKLPQCADAFVAGINGLENPTPETPTETMLIELEAFDTTLAELKKAHTAYWKL